MKKEITHINQFILAGLTVRTNNKNEMNPTNGKIGPLVQRYWNDKIAEKIQYRTNYPFNISKATFFKH